MSSCDIFVASTDMIYCLFLIAVAVNVSRISMSVKATIVRMKLSALMVSTNTSVDVDQDLRAHTATSVRFMLCLALEFTTRYIASLPSSTNSSVITRQN